MKKFLIILVVVLAAGAATIHFTGKTERFKEFFSGAKDKSKGYKKEIAEDDKDDKVDYETSMEGVDRYATVVRDSLKRGEEATEPKAKLGSALKKFSIANKKMNKLGYLFEDQYKANKKRITELESIVQ